MFYNVENFFDCRHDSLKNDLDFTPEGAYHWTPKRFNQKKINIAKTIAAAGGESGATIIGLCEIENRRVLDALLFGTGLHNAGYKIIHYESPDKRGVDTALLYDRKRFKPLNSKPIKVVFSADSSETTRDILYVKGLLADSHALHVFVCHAPSRRGGEAISRPKREAFAGKLRSVCDSIFSHEACANILIMGDFNDNPDNASVRHTLGANPADGSIADSCNVLYNLSYSNHRKGYGSYKYQGNWDMLDQIIVSANLLTDSCLHVASKDAVIFSAPFLLEEDTRYFGTKPRRTYLGPRYVGGFSDHLPTYVELKIKN